MSFLIEDFAGVVITSQTDQSFRLISTSELLKSSIHSGSPPNGANIISFITTV